MGVVGTEMVFKASELELRTPHCLSHLQTQVGKLSGMSTEEDREAISP